MSFANAATPSTSTCSIESFPFDFFAASGTRVAGVLDADGFCVFPDAACSPANPIAGCCRAKESVETTGDKYMFLAFAFILAPSIFISNSGQQDPEARDAQNRKMIPSWVRAMPGRAIAIPVFMMGLYAYIAMLITVPIVMRVSIQQTLNVVNRNAVIAAEAFLVPYNQIFQFIEDIVMVRVNYALALKQKALTNELVHVGLLGSFGTGLIAAILATILGVIPPALAGLTNPGATNDLRTYPGCDLLTDSTAAVLPYWLVEAWAIPGKQMGMVMVGFMMGAMELPTVGWIGAIGISLILIVWFVFVKTASNPLLVLAFAEFSSSWAVPILSVAYLVSPLGADLRANTGVHLQLAKFRGYMTSTLTGSPPSLGPGLVASSAHSATTEQDGALGEADRCPSDVQGEDKRTPANEDTGVDDASDAVSLSNGGGATSPPPPASHLPQATESTQALLLEGFKIMFMDVAVQCCISLGIYLALAKDAAEAYQLTALQSALPTYGMGTLRTPSVPVDACDSLHPALTWAPLMSFFSQRTQLEWEVRTLTCGKILRRDLIVKLQCT
jgi:hypothetical protein